MGIQETASLGKYLVTDSSIVMSRGAFVEQLAENPELGIKLTKILAAHPFAAFAWECPPFSAQNTDKPMAFVIVDSPGLTNSVADSSAFDDPFSQASGSVATFPSLRGDAVLVAPRPGLARDSTHLAAFLRTASEAASLDLWRAVGLAVRARLAAKSEPLWLSTAGLGVPWLHIRLDSTPKYYRHRPFQSVSS